MDKDILRLPSDPSSDSCSSGGPRTLSFHNCPPPSYNVANSTIGLPPSASAAAYSQFLPASPPGHPFTPPPGLSHPGVTNIYQFPPHCSPPPSYQNINFAPEMPGTAANQGHLGGHYPNAPLKSPVGHYHNGFTGPNGTVPTYPGYAYFGNMHHAQAIQPDSPPVSQHHPCGPFNKSPYDQPTYQRQQPNDSLKDFQTQLNLLSGSKNKNPLGAYDDGKGRNEFLQPQVKPSAFQEKNISGMNSVYSYGKDDNKSSISNGVGRVMNPIIENLVGSMSMCNGTYTHFGPSVPATNKGVNGQSELLNEANLSPKQNVNFEPEHKTLFSKIAVTPISQKDKDLENNATSAAKHETVRQMQMMMDQDALHESSTSLSRNNINTMMTSSEADQRSASPRESNESSSRPQTPGKPSYLEVLTKAGMKSSVNSPSRKTSSSSSSPVQSSFSGNSDSVPNLAHRKSVDIFTGSASTTSSSCPSSSSSPATKQRNSICGVLSKGKENFSSTPGTGIKKQSSIDRNSASNSPIHQNQHPFQSKGRAPTGSASVAEERKVLSSQNSGFIKGSKGNKSGKTSTEKLNQFEDLKDDRDGEWEWKTYTSRSRNNNLCNIGNKNSQKRTNSGQSISEPGLTNLKALNDEDDDSDEKKSEEDSVYERKSGFSNFVSLASSASGSGVSHSRKQREKEKSRSRKEGRNCVSRRLESLFYLWLAHLISALAWLWSLVTDVASLSASLGVSLMQDFYGWAKTKALPNVSDIITGWTRMVCQTGQDFWANGLAKLATIFTRGGPKPGQEDPGTVPGFDGDKNILSLLGPERNITLPANGDEALKRLLSVKGQDPYSILGVRSDSSEETIRRYYKRQAVLVHPDKNLIVGAEEAFKILARAFEMVGDPVKRAEYHQKLMEAQAKEKFCGEIGNLLEQLRKKMEAASSTIRCTKCNSRHIKNITDRPLFAARYCSQCRIHHGAREGELWAERKGWFGIAWSYFACMDGHIWEINEWARCQKANLKHIKADAHCVMYRLVAGGNNQNHNGQHCHGNGSAFEEGAGSEADEWDSLINNLYKSPSGSAYGKATGTGVPGKAGCCGSGAGVNNNTSSSTAQTAGKRRKGKRNK